MIPLCKKLSSFIERCSAWLGGFLLLVNVADIVVGIVARYCFNASIIWTEELARFSLVWMVLIGAAGAFSHGDHMSIDFLVARFSRVAKALINFFTTAVQVVVLVVLIYYGSQNVAGMWKMKTMALGVPRAIPLMALPIGMAMLLVQVLLHYVDSFASVSKEERA